MKRTVHKKQKYVPSISQMMGQCTLNYIQLVKLMPNIRQLNKNDRVSFQLGASDTTVVTCYITEAAAYTTFLTFTQLTEQEGSDLGLDLELKFCVRLYHDAQLAEVVDAERNAIIPGRMDYPNPRMQQIDEKAQSNKFFGEWLGYCRKHGIAICDFDLPSSEEQFPALKTFPATVGRFPE